LKAADTGEGGGAGDAAEGEALGISKVDIAANLECNAEKHYKCAAVQARFV
jgi:hypothetical protein